MKKKLLLALFLSASLTMTACQQKEDIEEKPPVEDEEIPGEEENENESGELELPEKPEDIEKVDFDSLTTASDLKDIINGIYSSANIDPEFLESLSNFHMLNNLTDKNDDTIKYYLGDKYDFKEGYVSESGMSTTAYNLILLRADDEESAKKLSEDVKKSVDPGKWICVAAETVESSSKGNLAIIVMGEKDVAKAIIETFDSLK